MNEPSRLAEMVGYLPTAEREVSTDQIRTRVFQYVGAVRYPLRHLPEDGAVGSALRLRTERLGFESGQSKPLFLRWGGTPPFLRAC